MSVLKILTYALVSTWSLVSSGWKHVKWKMHPCQHPPRWHEWGVCRLVQLFNSHLCGAGKKIFCWRSSVVCSFSFFRCTWGLMQGRPRSHRSSGRPASLSWTAPFMWTITWKVCITLVFFCKKKRFYAKQKSISDAIAQVFSPKIETKFGETSLLLVNQFGPLSTDWERRKSCRSSAGRRLMLETMWLQIWRRQWSQSRAPRLHQPWG